MVNLYNLFLQKNYDENSEGYHFLLTVTADGTTWLEKVRDGDRQAAHLLLQEH